VRLVLPVGGATGGSGNMSTSLSNVARLAAHPQFVWVFNANYDGTIIYNELMTVLPYYSNLKRYKTQTLKIQVRTRFCVYKM
jgi:hypothetical protein